MAFGIIVSSFTTFLGSHEHRRHFKSKCHGSAASRPEPHKLSLWFSDISISTETSEHPHHWRSGNIHHHPDVGGWEVAEHEVGVESTCGWGKGREEARASLCVCVKTDDDITGNYLL